MALFRKPCFWALRLPRAHHSISERFPVEVRERNRAWCESELFVITDRGLCFFLFVHSRAAGSRRATRFLILYFEKQAESHTKTPRVLDRFPIHTPSARVPGPHGSNPSASPCTAINIINCERHKHLYRVRARSYTARDNP